MKRVALPAIVFVVVATLVAGGVHLWKRGRQDPGSAATAAAAPATPAGVIRLSGTVEATRARTVIVPRMAGQATPTIVITRLIPAGSHVRAGDVIVEFDRQEQMRIARERRAELVDLDGQIQKKKSEQSIARAADETALAEAERNVGRAELDVRTNDLISKVAAEKNNLALEQAKARFNQLKQTFDLKRKAAEADLKILEIKRARSELALQYAEKNSELMSVQAPFSGLVVLKQVWKGNSQAPVAEGEEVRAGLPILDIVDASAMQVRAMVNQADIGLIAPGKSARVRLDAYPQLLFDGRVEVVAPLGVASSLTPKVRGFTAIISIHGEDPQLMPDLTASVEVGADAAAQGQAAVTTARTGGD
jgi:multidrug resistance efflux pump